MNIQIYNADSLNKIRKDDGCFVPDVLELKTGQVHIWKVSFNLPDNVILTLKNLLSDEEINRAERFRFHHLRRRYIVFHSTLKKILGRYLGLKEEEISFEQGPHGKPAVLEELNSENIRFNMSKSSETGVYAFMLQGELGIDIENIRPFPNMNAIVERHFSENETCVYEELPNEEKLDWFYTIWTRKEALLKAIGLGLYLPLEEMDVSDTGNIKIDSDIYRQNKTASAFILDDLKLPGPGIKSAICTVYNFLSI